MDKNLLFALDIGTRSVVGLILKQLDNGKFEVLHMKVKEHEERSMLDGQIHHIPAVARVIKSIKEELENDLGSTLKKVCVAAAGRALKTVKGKAEKDISETPIYSKEEIVHMELMAVQQAQFHLATQLTGASTSLYDCVGYSVLHYYLDDQEIGSFIGQQGEKTSVEVIATFLPRVVVESLMRALKETELEMEALTLEPIAAINVLIPPSMRKLNVALVDIGAGTSDIALTAEGTVVAYGMVPVAGDEITEAISSEYLLDFPVAEEMKRALWENDSVEFTDILGTTMKKTKQEVIESIRPAIDHLAERITYEILQLNAKTPQAIMLVGGGSLTPGLRERLSEKLNLPIERVAIRGVDAISSLVPTLSNKGPELVTPVGIGIAARENPVKYVSVTVNQKTHRLFDVKKLTVGDALIAGGTDLSRLYGKPGMGVMVRIHNEVRMFKGELGTPPTLLLNGIPTTVSEEINDGDTLLYEAGMNGKPAEITIRDAAGNHQVKRIIINDQPFTIETEYFLNSNRVPADTIISDRDEILSYFPECADEVLESCGVEIHSDNSEFSFKVNGKTHKLPKRKTELLLNDRLAQLKDSLQDGDKLEVKYGNNQSISLHDVLTKLDVNLHQSCTVWFNDQEVTLLCPLFQVLRQGHPLDESSTIYPNDELYLEAKVHKPFIFQDVFAEVDISINPKPGETLVILKNEEKAGFQTEIETGDRLQLRFEVRV